MANWSMSDIKIVKVVLGSGGEIAATFDHDRGELSLWPNECVKDAPDDATHYGLTEDATMWSIMDAEDD